jgi:hypothetical protein
MSEKGSVFQKGGGGTNFEQYVQAAFLTTLIIRGNAPGIPTNKIVEVAFQTTNKGYETDDLLIIANSNIGQHRLLVQIKHDISFTIGNREFQNVINAFWKDYNNYPLFDKTKDKLLIIKNGFTKDERNHIKSLIDWANTHSNENDFLSEVKRLKAKRERLDVFKECLKIANNNTALTNNELWNFLKCFDVLEYDFDKINSIDETYFLNLIKLCKNNTITTSEKEIWNAILTEITKLNQNGGNIVSTSIPEELSKYFELSKLNPFWKSIDKLKKDSKEILRPIKNYLGKDSDKYHLKHTDKLEELFIAINKTQFTIVTGKPGVGKSAIVKDLFEQEFSNANIFVFKADQFNKPHLANVFSSQGVNESIQDIFSCIASVKEKIIFIDSAEKLLEGDNDSAFKQLFLLLKEYPDIKVICTSRKYAIDLIILKFEIDKNNIEIVEVLPLNNDELITISENFQQIKSILKNQAVTKLLQSFKYVDFAISSLNKTSDDFTNISLTEFINKLWDLLVKDITKGTPGIPLKREDTFMDIAVKRAKEMKLFIEPTKGYEEVIDLLIRDDIIIKEEGKRRYSPTHDILEDWALVKYISSIYDQYNSSCFFMKKLEMNQLLEEHSGYGSNIF